MVKKMMASLRSSSPKTRLGIQLNVGSTFSTSWAPATPSSPAGHLDPDNVFPAGGGGVPLILPG